MTSERHKASMTKVDPTHVFIVHSPPEAGSTFRQMINQERHASALKRTEYVVINLRI